MSTMISKMKISVDENAVDKFSKVKKAGVVANEKPKRAALGDLQNRGVLRPVAGKEAVQKDVKDLKSQYGLRHIKSSVESQLHLKKTASNVANKIVNAQTSNTTNVAATTTGTNAAGQRKVLTRSNSLRIGGAAVKKPASNVGLQRQGSTYLPGVQNKQKTLTTKVVESKLQPIKNVTAKTMMQSNTKTALLDPLLKREDSNLSRKSVSKIKSTLLVNEAVPKIVPKVNATQTAVLGVRKEKRVGSSSTKVASNDENSKQVQTTAKDSITNFKLVEDIDSEDAENFILVSEYVNDIYDYLYQLEEEQLVNKNHLDGQEEVYPKMRSVLLDWINEVHVQFRLVPETFQISVGILDRYLQIVKNTKRALLQLVGVTALFIAAKYEELYPPSIADFVYITDNTYSAKQILQMEINIFKTLDCNLSRPLPIHFLRRFSKAAKAEDRHHAMSKYFLELSMIEYEMASYKPSEIAAASLFLSLQLFEGDINTKSGVNNALWTPTLTHYSRYPVEHLRPISQKIATIAFNAPKAKLKAVYSKYQSSKFDKISTRNELYSPLMESIINSKD